MEKNYKLDKVRAIADGDTDFIITLIQAFLEEVPIDAEKLKLEVENKNYLETYRTAHKMKPTIEMFDLGVYDELIEVQDWGKFEKKEIDITPKLTRVLEAIEATVSELKSDFKLT